MAEYQEIGYDIILSEIPLGARVLDLGCGNGSLLVKLREEKNVNGYGVEISEDGVSKCLEKGLYCYQGDIDEGLKDYKDNSFDFVILNQTLQSTKRPDYVLHEILRICKNTIISFPNFGYYVTRLQLLFKGTMPINNLLPFEWYESPNIHLLTIRDFQILCSDNNYPIKKEIHFSVTDTGKTMTRKVMPNITAQYGLFILDGEGITSAAL